MKFAVSLAVALLLSSNTDATVNALAFNKDEKVISLTEESLDILKLVGIPDRFQETDKAQWKRFEENSAVREKEAQAEHDKFYAEKAAQQERDNQARIAAVKAAQQTVQVEKNKTTEQKKDKPVEKKEQVNKPVEKKEKVNKPVEKKEKVIKVAENNGKVTAYKDNKIEITVKLTEDKPKTKKDDFAKNDDFEDKTTPDRFKENSDDIFMRSMYRSYATELEEEDKKTGKKEKTGKQVVTKSSAYQAGLEVLGTHKGLKAADLSKHMETYFDNAWSHYDVMQQGWIAVEVMPMLMRFLASDQLIHIYNQKSDAKFFNAPIPAPASKPTLAKENPTPTPKKADIRIINTQQKDMNAKMTTEKKDNGVIIKMEPSI